MAEDTQPGVGTERESGDWEIVDIGPTFTFGRNDCPCGRDRTTFDPEHLYCPFCLAMMQAWAQEEYEAAQEDSHAE